MATWELLAATLGPQSAPYMFPEDWDGKLRTIACRCGALLEILADEPSPAPGDYLCDACTIRFAFMHGDDLERGYWQWRLAGVLRGHLAALGAR
jgi:hypothetical protein